MTGSKKDEINLLELIADIWRAKKLISIVAIAFTVLGIIIALLSPVEYEATCKIMVDKNETGGAGLSGLSGLAGLAGINIDPSGAGGITPDMYPAIVESLPFQLSIIHKEIFFKELDRSVSSYEYLTELRSPSVLSVFMKYTIGLPGILRGWLSSFFNDEVLVDQSEPGKPQKQQPMFLTYEDKKIVERFRKRFQIGSEEGSGLILITTEMPDPMAAAYLTQSTVNLLTERIISFKIEKVKANLEFIQERYEEIKKEYYRQQKELALFNDQNRNLNRALAEIENNRLQQELNITFEVYKGLATQLEQAKIKVKEEMPVFTILEPVVIPVNKSQPKRALIVVSTFFFGLMAAIVFVTGRSILSLDLLEPKH
jgi:uncharacterized protein involved in exopolysaccharide biosynthesis